MPAKQPRSKPASLVGQIVGGAAKGKKGAAQASLERFIRLYYSDISSKYLADCSVEDLRGAVLSIWDFCRQRIPGKEKIRIFNPRPEKDGWQSSHTIIEIINDDMPFLVDSVTAELNRHDLTVHHIIHPVFDVERTKDGRLLHINAREGGKNSVLRESFMHIEIDQQTSPDFLKHVQKCLQNILEDARLTVKDWLPMRNKMGEIADRLNKKLPLLPASEVSEGIAFLRWLLDNHFTFLGYREYRLVEEKGKEYLRPVPKSGLGILRKMTPEAKAHSQQPLSPNVRRFAHKKLLLTITKTNARATVHRRAHMEYIGIRVFDAKGNVIGEQRFHGLYTSTAYSRSPREIPILRHKVAATLERAGFLPGSHDGKALLHILETYPRDELFQVSEPELHRISMGILALQERRRVAFFARRDVFERFVSCLVYLPRDIYDTEMRERIQEELERAYGGEMTDYYTQVGDSVLARLLFIVHGTSGKIRKVDEGKVQQRLVEVVRSWEEDLREALILGKGEEQGLALFREYAKAFPSSYREYFDAEAAIGDLAKVSDVLTSRKLGLNLYRLRDSASNELRFKIYNYKDPVPLSDVLPMLENMGLRVIGEVPFKITPKGAEGVFIHDFRAVVQRGNEVKLEDVKANFEEAFRNIWNGDVENDLFNSLVVAAGLTSREIVILRAFRKYLRQIGIPFSQAYMSETLVRNAPISRMIVELFATLFDPKNRHRAELRAAKLRNAIEEALEKVPNLDQDRILRRYGNLVEATQRTNYFQQDAEARPKPYLSFKFAAQLIEGLPLPRPMFEIFVYSPRMEGVHLRGGRVARGGIRWSDRREDFRTEILGLMKAQTVKNAVIVPVGAKGGFVIKNPPAGGGREALMAEVVACYKTLICGMLDLTDNLDGDQPIRPLDTICRDDPDPYLVVAADKGTAAFSDIANALSKAYGFWLGDAFASGGSHGYDHKKMGITARGAWESVKRHFRETGVDIHATDFTVVGVGDMSGDVFGNGMLLSQHARLLAAFNHQHIFIDPDPDALKSLAERERLFKIPRSAWSDYNPRLISKGGGVFDRSAKSIKLSPEIQARFGITAATATPNDLIRFLLRADVDLLWLGGIGTYVKATEETDAAVGDRANDAIRVNGRDLRCRVVGEGANLGFTQLGRVEYALVGGRLNTDSIDNSGGVNCSDHEVNIKILLNEIVASGKLTEHERNRLLARMTREVANLVLKDSYLHTQAITYVALHAADLLDRQAALMRLLERKGKLDRTIEFLPTNETIEERLLAGQGLTRPEIAILASYAKIWVYGELLESDLPDDPLLVADLKRYFPAPLQKTHGAAIERHRLRREIVATQIANGFVNRMSGAMIGQMVENTGMPLSDIARAYLITREVFNLLDIWERIQTLDNKVAAGVQTEMFWDIARLVERGTLWCLRNATRPLDIATHLKKFGNGVHAFRISLGKILPEEDKADVRRHKERYVSAGVPEKLAGEVAEMDFLVPAFDVVAAAQDSGRSVGEIGKFYFKLGVTFGLDWLRSEGRRILSKSHWQKTAIEAIVDDLFGQQAALTRRIVRVGEGKPLSDDVFDSWVLENKLSVERTRQLFNDIRSASATGNFDLAMLTVANRQVRSLIQE
ncbi:MAG: NAD-glutamate dehydrogenase [Pseudomonadota bacterium]